MDSKDELPTSEENMQVYNGDKFIDMADFGANETKHFRLCLNFMLEGPTTFKMNIVYNVLKIFEGGRSE